MGTTHIPGWWHCIHVYDLFHIIYISGSEHFLQSSAPLIERSYREGRTAIVKERRKLITLFNTKILKTLILKGVVAWFACVSPLSGKVGV